MESRFRTPDAERYAERYAPDLGPDLAMRVYTANLLGEDPEIALHRSGSVSLKARAIDFYDDPVEVLHVTGDDEALAGIEPSGFVACRLAALRRLCERPGTTDEEALTELSVLTMPHNAYVQGNAARKKGEPARVPSAHTIVHAILPGKFVEHAQADSILVIVNQPGAAEIVREIYGDRALFVPYTPPGIALAHRVAEALWKRASSGARAPSLLITDRNGIFTWGDSALESYDIMVSSISRAERYITETRVRESRPTISAPDPELYARLAPIARGLLMKASGRPWILTWRTSALMRAFCDRVDMTLLAQFGCAAPDHAAIMKPKPLVIGELDATSVTLARKRINDGLLTFAAAYEEYTRRVSSARKTASPAAPPMLSMPDPWPRVMLFEGLGALTVADSASKASEAADLYEHTATIIDSAHAILGYQPAVDADIFEGEHGAVARSRAARRESPAKPLDARIALIVGGAAGVGLATARAFVRAGAHVVLADRSQEALEEAATVVCIERADHGKRITCVACNVGSEAEVRRALAHACTSFGGVDIVVSSAGGAWMGMGTGSGALHTSVGSGALRSSLDLNLLGHQNVARAAVETMLLQGTGGVLLFTASKSPGGASSDEPGRPGAGPDAVSRAALIALMRQYAIELGQHGIRANVVSLDRVRTDFSSERTHEAREKARTLPPEEYFRTNFLNRETTPDDVAAAFLYLATAQATTGCVLTVDGGSDAIFSR